MRMSLAEDQLTGVQRQAVLYSLQIGTSHPTLRRSAAPNVLGIVTQTRNVRCYGHVRLTLSDGDLTLLHLQLL